MFLLLLAALLCATDSRLDKQLEEERKRDHWQEPQRVLGQLGLFRGARAADVGAGRGYFTARLSAAVGPDGTVYAVDLDKEALEFLRERVTVQHLSNVQVIEGRPDNPELPSSELDAVLVFNAYHEMRDYDAMLAALYRALQPGGRLAIIDGAIEGGQARDDYFSRHRIPKEVVREEAERHGFAFLREEKGFSRTSDGKQFYFLIFIRPN